MTTSPSPQTSPDKGSPPAPRITGLLKEKRSRQGRVLVNNIYALLKIALIHDPANEAYQNALEKFQEILKAVLEDEESITIKRRAELLYFNDVRLRVDMEGFVSFKFVADELKRRQIGALHFESKQAVNEVKDFVTTFIGADLSVPQPFEALELVLKNRGVNNIDIERFLDQEEALPEEEVLDRRQMALKTFYKAIMAVKEVMGGLEANRAVYVRKAKKIVQQLVDQIIEDEVISVTLTTIKNYDDYTYNHSVNVCIYSIIFGVKLGLDKKRVADLGMAALFHDTGKAAMPKEILNKPARLTEKEWEFMKLHPFVAAKNQIKMREFSDQALLRAIVAFEHHLNYNLSGYPELVQKRMPNLYSRIVKISDSFDAMTTTRSYQKPYSPDEALKVMMGYRGIYFDPLLLKVFINTIGIYPIGTLVLLNSREVGIVCRPPLDSKDLDKPLIMLIADSQGRKIEKQVVDLAQDSGAQERQIIKSLDPQKYNINIADYLLEFNP